MTSPLRKAAVLIYSLDRASADALLDQMPDDFATRVRQAVLDLDEVDPAEQRAVMTEFLRRKAGSNSMPGVELDLSPASVRGTSLVGRPVPLVARETPVNKPFSFLYSATGQTLGKFLEREHPQTVALVIAHLPPARAAETLARLPGALQTEVLRRVADLEETDPEVLRELEQSLEHLLADELRARHRRSAGVAAIGAILNAARDDERGGMLANLKLADSELAARVRAAGAYEELDEPAARPARASFWSRFTSPAKQAIPQELETDEETESDVYDEGLDDEDTEIEELNDAGWEGDALLSFDDFTRFDDRALALVLRAAEPRIAQLALTGARPELIARLLRQLPAKEAKEMQRRLDLSGPLRLREVEVAQRQLAWLASRMASRGEIQLPAPRRFAAAA